MVAIDFNGDITVVVLLRRRSQSPLIRDYLSSLKELCNKVFSKGSFVRLGVLIEEVTTRNKSNAYDNV